MGRNWRVKEHVFFTTCVYNGAVVEIREVVRALSLRVSTVIILVAYPLVCRTHDIFRRLVLSCAVSNVRCPDTQMV